VLPLTVVNDDSAMCLGGQGSKRDVPLSGVSTCKRAWEIGFLVYIAVHGKVSIDQEVTCSKGRAN